MGSGCLRREQWNHPTCAHSRTHASTHTYQSGEALPPSTHDPRASLPASEPVFTPHKPAGWASSLRAPGLSFLIC